MPVIETKLILFDNPFHELLKLSIVKLRDTQK